MSPSQSLYQGVLYSNSLLWNPSKADTIWTLLSVPTLIQELFSVINVAGLQIWYLLYRGVIYSWVPAKIWVPLYTQSLYVVVYTFLSLSLSSFSLSGGNWRKALNKRWQYRSISGLIPIFVWCERYWAALRLTLPSLWQVAAW